ncbi:hypothetical protein DH2020_030391 [Rehmannia glutinosa]|uniref:DNA sliding clamp PCNA n=1 Tax=Rehmannia glutinosa TaxID=99300 RepID=A0ABR0VPJ9_REHGL
MFELRLVEGGLLKKILESLKDLVNDANFDCSATGFSLQAMDSSHVALVAFLLRAEGFDHYRCDRNLTMGMNLGNMAKMLKCAANDDIVTIKADDGTDTVTFMFENTCYPSLVHFRTFQLQNELKRKAATDDYAVSKKGNAVCMILNVSNILYANSLWSFNTVSSFWVIVEAQDKIADFEMKLMDIDSEHLGIPEAEFEAIVRMPSAEYARICRDLSSIGDTVVISVSKEGVRFSTRGDIGTANIVCRQNTSLDNPEDATVIEMEKPVTQTFALRYMSSFAKATPLANQVTISMSSELPVVVEYKIAEVGYLRFYLAPKIEEEEENAAAQLETKPKMQAKPKPKPQVEPILVEESELVEETKPKVEPILTEESEFVDERKPKVEIKPETESNGEADASVETKPESETNGEAEVMDVE